MTSSADFTLKFQEVNDILAPYESQDFATGDDKLVSLKLRPVENEVGPSDCYVYPAEYEEIYRYLNETFGLPIVDKTKVHHGYGLASVYKLPSGEHFLFVEHESGPELIAFLHTIRDVLTAGTEAVISLGAFLTAVNKVAHIIRTSIDEYNRKPSGRRHNGASAIKVERRTAVSTRAIRSIKVKSDSDEAVKYIHDVDRHD
ncbi:hypothetical protein [Chromobacterium vaccinii]|uniref:hypothetical protein n=1 Tax=Chromobacterium vaccinii TaxID=1108595 RepID=UPI0006181DBC|nr:hypothetical protein [Chromobacterium vaccinii]